MNSNTKCPACENKANRLGIVCKCGQKFCMEHRMPEAHKCTFDFKTPYQKKIMDTLTSSTRPKIIESSLR